MEEIRDAIGRLVCECDPVSGYIRNYYKKQEMIVVLPPGGQATIIREGVMTNIKRVNGGTFNVYTERSFS